jgi:Ca2+-binding EF-hand superfamily protein
VFATKISLKEFDARREKLQGSVFHSLNMCASSSEFAFMSFREMDPDGNGAVSLKDFCEYVKRVEIDIESEFGDMLAVGDRRGMTLAEAESNIKQVVTRREWNEGRAKLLRSVFQSLQMCAADEKFASAAFQQMDSERNGRVSLRQFCHFVKNNEIKIDSEWGEVLAVGDNEAGALSLAEANALTRKTVTRREWDEGRAKLLRSVFQSLQMCSADENFADAAFEQMDVESNGRVTLEQFCHFIKSKEITIQSEWDEVLAVGDNEAGALSLAEANALTRKTVTRREWDEGRAKLLRSVFQSLQMCSADENFADAAFEQMDVESNGRVTLEQFCHFIKNKEIRIQSEWGEVLAVGDNEAGALSLAEANALTRKTVTRREWNEGRSKFLRSVFESLQMCSVDENFANTAFEKMDIKNTGRLTLEQFCHFIKDKEIKIQSEWGEVLSVGDNEAGALSLVEANAKCSATVSRREWNDGRSKFRGSPFRSLQMCSSSNNVADTAFDEMDSSSHGKVRLESFVRWIRETEIRVDSDIGRLLSREIGGKRSNRLQFRVLAHDPDTCEKLELVVRDPRLLSARRELVPDSLMKLLLSKLRIEKKGDERCLVYDGDDHDNDNVVRSTEKKVVEEKISREEEEEEDMDEVVYEDDEKIMDDNDDEEDRRSIGSDSKRGEDNPILDSKYDVK